MNTVTRELIAILSDGRDLLAKPGNDFTWSSWNDATAALRDVDRLILAIRSGSLPPRLELAVLFAPTGPIQEVSLSSGWAWEFIALSQRFDAALEQAYA
jgi:hypothetical protein